MKERKFVIIAIAVAGIVALLLGGYYGWKVYFPEKKVVENDGLLPVYSYYRGGEVAVATIRYTNTGFERESFTLASPEYGVVVVINDDPEATMSLEIAEGPGDGYPESVPDVLPGVYTEIRLEEPGHYLIRDTLSPETVYFSVDLYSSVEEAKTVSSN